MRGKGRSVYVSVCVREREREKERERERQSLLYSKNGQLVVYSYLQSYLLDSKRFRKSPPSPPHIQ